MSFSGAARIAGVIGDPIAHSLSPAIHNAWIAAAGLDAVYIPLRPGGAGFATLVGALRGGAMIGLNVTAPFKEEALALASRARARATRAGSANLLIFGEDGVEADSTDGQGLLAAFAEQAPGFDFGAAPALVIGAGGAARAAIAAVLEAGAPEVRIFNRSPERAMALATALGAGAVAVRRVEDALVGVGAIINATPSSPAIPLELVGESVVVMDMVYRPLATPLLRRARERGLRTVDGLAMLIAQARPSFEALFGAPPPDIDVRAVALAAGDL
jgi:shikimate dehydrogenase